jgi:hypothetical protein
MRYNERVLTGVTTKPHAKVLVELVTGTPVNASASAANTVLSTWTVYASAQGNWRVGLPINEQVTPGNTRYRVTEYDTSTVVSTCVVPQGTTPLVLESIAGAVAEPTFSVLTLADAANVIVGSTTGTKVGTSATQKLGFYGATPVVRPTATPADATDLATALTLLNNLKAKLIALGLVA